jgi:hypothetical protein
MYTVYHCFMFDRGRCLVPSRRDWHRCVLVWMLVSSSMGLLIWASAWACAYRLCHLQSRQGRQHAEQVNERETSSRRAEWVGTDTADVKYQLGWTWLGAARGARPWPSVLFPKPYDSFNKPLTIILSRKSPRLKASLHLIAHNRERGAAKSKGRD